MSKLVNLSNIRFEVLDRCFSDKTRYYYIEDLLKHVNEALIANGEITISERTLRININQMITNPKWNVVLIEKAFINRRRYFRYEDPNYSIFRRDLNEHQLAQLKSMMLMLQQFRGIPQFERIQELMQDLERHYHFELDCPENIISFDTNQYVDGIKHLSKLFEATVNQQSLRITYHPHKKDAYACVVHPYHIKQYNGRWFLFGLGDKYRTIVNMALDRIEDIDFAHVPYISSEDIDFEEYFEDIIGVTIESDKVERVVLQFYNDRLPYVLSKPIHGSQRISREHKDAIELDIIPNREFYQQLLSFGEDVKVLFPEEIQKEMSKKVANLYKLYKK